ncbi:hypothetical protein LZ31DRAFT_232769, partial [Colletotrichum somersetense]
MVRAAERGSSMFAPIETALQYVVGSVVWAASVSFRPGSCQETRVSSSYSSYHGSARALLFMTLKLKIRPQFGGKPFTVAAEPLWLSNVRQGTFLTRGEIDTGRIP